MGRKDVVSRQYLSSDEVFADVVNLALYEGERIVQASDLVELDSTEEIAVTLEESLNKRTGNRKQTHAIQKYRDIVRQVMIDSTEEYLARIIVGIEEQSEVHYAMPVRNMLYDALNYSDQVSRITERNRLEGIKVSSAEFLSGFRKDDRLIPVITIVVTFQSEIWDGPMSVHDMLELRGIPERLKMRIPNYEMLLLQPLKYDESKEHDLQSTFGVVMGLLKYASSMEKFQQYVDEHENILSNMPARAAAVVNEFCTLDMSEQELEERRVINMCQAVRQMKEVSRREGEIAGEIKGEIKGQVKVYYQKLNYSVDQIAQELGISVEAVEEIIRTL